MNELSPVFINNEEFEVIKPERLLPGMVLKSRQRDVYARLGPKQNILEEQIHTESLANRGFPVAKVLESGDYENDQWYFIEESLGNEPFHVQFAGEWQRDGRVSNATFSRYRDTVTRYIETQSDPVNRENISAKEFVATVIPDEEILANYIVCGGSVDRYHEAIARATERIADAAMGVLQFDLNPYNILNRGVIDFEMVGYGPIGYDTLTVSQWHLWFVDDQTSRYKISYRLSEGQIKEIESLVSYSASKNNFTDPKEFLQEFLLIKTAWGFTSEKLIHDEPESKVAFYRYRAALLNHCVDTYLARDIIDPQDFPELTEL